MRSLRVSRTQACNNRVEVWSTFRQVNTKMKAKWEFWKYVVFQSLDALHLRSTHNLHDFDHTEWL